MDVDLVTLTGGTCVSNTVNYYVAFLTMSSLPFIIVFFSSINYAIHRCTLKYTIKRINKQSNALTNTKKKKKALLFRDNAYIESFLIADDNNNLYLNNHEIIQIVKLDLHVDLSPIDGLKFIHLIHALHEKQQHPTKSDATVTRSDQLSLKVFLHALHTNIMDTALLAIQKGKDGIVKNNQVGTPSRDVLLKSILTRTLFSSAFMVSIYLLMLIHAPLSKKLFLFYVCQNVGNLYYMKADYNIQCYTSDWNAFHPVILFNLFVYTIGFPLLLICVIYWAHAHHKLYHRSFYSKMGFLYSGYHKGTEWWEIHQILRKIMLTGLLMFASDRPMVRSVVATMICIVGCINLNYFKPHRNRLVFWVTQVANVSSTLKYLIAVVIASNGNAIAGRGSDQGESTAVNSGGATAVAAATSYQDQETIGVILVVCDVTVMAFSVLASIACFYILQQTLTKNQEGKQATNEALLPLARAKRDSQPPHGTAQGVYSTKKAIRIHPSRPSGLSAPSPNSSFTLTRSSNLATARIKARLRDSEMCSLRISELKCRVASKNFIDSSEKNRMEDVVLVKTTVQDANKHSAEARARTHERHLQKRLVLAQKIKQIKKLKKAKKKQHSRRDGSTLQNKGVEQALAADLHGSDGGVTVENEKHWTEQIKELEKKAEEHRQAALFIQEQCKSTTRWLSKHGTNTASSGG